jgi:phage gp45-like
MNLWHRLCGVVTRGKFQTSSVQGRTIVQVQGLDQEEFGAVELLLPPGYVARPLPTDTADPLILEIAGQSGHKVAIGGDDTADSVGDLQPGECGLSRASQTILLRLNGVFVDTTFTVQIAAPELKWSSALGGDLLRLVNETMMQLFNTHTHAGGSPPDQQMTSDQLTGS